MYDHGVDVIKLPRQGFALIAGDLHGNMGDFNKLMEIWEGKSTKNNHLILTGDFIHAMGSNNDKSLEILDTLRAYYKKFENFHLLLGNHELATITKFTLYKGGVNQSLNFQELLKGKFGGEWEEKLLECTNFFKELPVAVKTANKVFISHAGPPKNINSLKEMMNITRKGYYNNLSLYELLWRRYGDYSKKDVDQFLENIGCRAMIVGHTPVDGYKLIGNQLIISSSYTLGKKAYVELDLKKEIRSGRDLKKMVKYFH